MKGMRKIIKRMAPLFRKNFSRLWDCDFVCMNDKKFKK